jgi:hypothetical protein
MNQPVDALVRGRDRAVPKNRERAVAPRFDAVESIVYDRSAGWSSLVARWAHNPKVGGSNPPPATNLKHFPFNHLKLFAATVRNCNRHPFRSHSLKPAV